MLRNLLRIGVGSCLIAFSLLSWAQAAPKPVASPLEPVSWFVGGTWVSDVKDPHVENHITWAPNHQAIQFVTDFNGTPHYNGFYAYDAAAKAIKFFYTSEQGQLTIRSAPPHPARKTPHHAQA